MAAMAMGGLTAVCALSSAFSVDTNVLGRGAPLARWSPDGHLLAVVGSAKVVRILRADGALIAQVVPPAAGLCSCLAWNAHGSVLCIAQEGSKVLVIWHRERREMETMEMPEKDVICAAWAPAAEEDGEGSNGNVMAMATARGKVMVVDVKSKQCVMWDAQNGKTQAKKKVAALEWIVRHADGESEEKNLQLDQLCVMYTTGDNSVLNICTWEGQVVEKINLPSKVVEIQSTPQPSSAEEGAGEMRYSATKYVSAILEDGTLILHQPFSHAGVTKTKNRGSMDRNSHRASISRETTSITRLVFDESYSKAICHRWFDEDHIVVGFGNGTILVVSVHDEEGMGEEMARTRFLRRGMQAIACEGGSQYMAVVGPEGLQTFDLMSWSLVSYQDCPSQLGKPDAISISANGQYVSVTFEEGSIVCYKMPFTENDDLEGCVEVDMSAWAHETIHIASLGGLYLMLQAGALILLSVYFKTDVGTVLRALRVI